MMEIEGWPNQDELGVGWNFVSLRSLVSPLLLNYSLPRNQVSLLITISLPFVTWT